jgi:hypothetical protein
MQLNFLDAEPVLDDKPFVNPQDPVTAAEVRKQNRAYARASDPRSSHQAAQDFTESGTFDSQNEMILWLATVNGGDWTVHELAVLSKDRHRDHALDATKIQKRVTGLKEAGEIELLGERKCLCHGKCPRTMQYWKIVK